MINNEFKRIESMRSSSVAEWHRGIPALFISSLPASRGLLHCDVNMLTEDAIKNALKSVKYPAVSYTHLTLPTILRV